ncbi:hemerythrin domain-containing protein [Reinekea sp.]|jgi:hemerythrin-like domain-containing protein|uniref:hemerythrin domain-containing protein n=1 Tax=Reinekea sp. TaxID=1970455 RepID=UPI002A7FCE72|nr:hemerythrin domain-containing protein [Reinekea sp.]
MSTAILQKLSAEHKNIAQVLYCLRAQIKGYDDPEIEPNIGQIMDILDYICTVPERWHHPVEDIVFTRLLAKNPPHPEQVHTALAEHAELERLTQELKTAFERVAMDIAVPVSLLYRTATLYLSRQMLHLDAEESVLFPMAEEYLDEDDWSDVEEAAQRVLESLDDNTEREYDNLHDAIINFTDAY